MAAGVVLSGEGRPDGERPRELRESEEVHQEGWIRDRDRAPVGRRLHTDETPLDRPTPRVVVDDDSRRHR
jgi:hypothetical protein